MWISELIELAVIFFHRHRMLILTRIVRYLLSARILFVSKFKILLSADVWQWELRSDHETFRGCYANDLWKNLVLCNSRKNFYPSVNGVNHLFPLIRHSADYFTQQPTVMFHCTILLCTVLGRKRRKEFPNRTVLQFGAAAGNCCLDLR